MKNAFACPGFDSNQPKKGLSIDLSVGEGCRLLSVYPLYYFIDTITDKKLIPRVTLRERKLLGTFKTGVKRRGISLKKMLWDFCVFRYAHIYPCVCMLRSTKVKTIVICFQKKSGHFLQFVSSKSADLTATGCFLLSW